VTDTYHYKGIGQLPLTSLSASTEVILKLTTKIFYRAIPIFNKFS